MVQYGDYQNRLGPIGKGYPFLKPLQEKIKKRCGKVLPSSLANRKLLSDRERSMPSAGNRNEGKPGKWSGWLITTPISARSAEARGLASCLKSPGRDNLQIRRYKGHGYKAAPTLDGDQRA